MSAVPSYKKIWNVSLPIIISLMAQDMIQVIDTAFLGRVGEVELGASAIGGLYYFLLFIVAFGFGTGSQIVIGRRNGERDYAGVGRVMTQSVYVLLFLSVLIWVVTHLWALDLLDVIISSPEVSRASEEYLGIRIWGIFFACQNIGFRALYVGTTKTRLLTWNAFFMAGVNIVLDYVLIFGKWGFPEMGIAGAALASVIAEAASTLFLIIATRYALNPEKYQLFKFSRPDFPLIRNVLDLSVFIMLQYFLSMASWFAFFVIIEKLGERELAASNIVRSAYMILMIPIWGLGSTVSTLVSNAIGEGHSDKVMEIIYKTLKISMMIGLGMAILGLSFPHQILSVYTSDPTLRQASLPILFVIQGALFLFSAAMIFFNGVSGTAATRTGLLIEVITLSFYLCFAVLFGLWLHLPVHQVWFVEYIYVLVMGSLSWWYLKSGKWKKLKV
jgi:putative MATE family efflux protein